MAATDTRVKAIEHTYEVPKKYEMMSEKKFRLALGTAIGALIAAIILAWIGLTPKVNAADANQNPDPKQTVIKKS
jgi:hypothetical protein